MIFTVIFIVGLILKLGNLAPIPWGVVLIPVYVLGVYEMSVITHKLKVKEIGLMAMAWVNVMTEDSEDVESEH